MQSIINEPLSGKHLISVIKNSGDSLRVRKETGSRKDPFPFFPSNPGFFRWLERPLGTGNSSKGLRESWTVGEGGGGERYWDGGLGCLIEGLGKATQGENSNVQSAERNDSKPLPKKRRNGQGKIGLRTETGQAHLRSELSVTPSPNSVRNPIVGNRGLENRQGHTLYQNRTPERGKCTSDEPEAIATGEAGPHGGRQERD